MEIILRKLPTLFTTLHLFCRNMLCYFFRWQTNLKSAKNYKQQCKTMQQKVQGQTDGRLTFLIFYQIAVINVHHK